MYILSRKINILKDWEIPCCFPNIIKVQMFLIMANTELYSYLWLNQHLTIASYVTTIQILIWVLQNVFQLQRNNGKLYFVQHLGSFCGLHNTFHLPWVI